VLAAGIPLAVASRACNIGLCSRLINTWRKHPLPPNLQRMLWAVGLRGAVAYGLGGHRRRGGDGSCVVFLWQWACVHTHLKHSNCRIYQPAAD